MGINMRMPSLTETTVIAPKVSPSINPWSVSLIRIIHPIDFIVFRFCQRPVFFFCKTGCRTKNNFSSIKSAKFIYQLNVWKLSFLSSHHNIDYLIGSWVHICNLIPFENYIMKRLFHLLTDILRAFCAKYTYFVIQAVECRILEISSISKKNISYFLMYNVRYSNIIRPLSVMK